MKVFTIQFTEDELTELENVLDQHVYAEAIENKGSEGTIGTIHNRILDVHYQNISQQRMILVLWLILV